MLRLDYESNFTEYALIAGVDEAGRGPLAGPVYVAAVIMPLEEDKIIEGINDSKKLSEKKREMLFEKILSVALCCHIEFVDEKTIDEINILNATKLGMERCLKALVPIPQIALIDAVKGLSAPCRCVPVIHGDALSYNIAAASILAKVARDRRMKELDAQFPGYGFAVHKGYGTAFHIDRLKTLGACPIHRRTFIKNFVFPRLTPGAIKIDGAGGE